MTDRLGFPPAETLAIVAAQAPAVARLLRILEGPEPSDPADHLRFDRHRSWITAAVPAVLGTENPATICSAWSTAADELLSRAFKENFGPGTALFALGKLGSMELNLSSDVDIVIVAQTEDPGHAASLRRFQKLLSEARPSGFALRTDFDLRPGGRQGPLVPTVDHFVDYYGNYGETWERMAFVRLRPICGDASVIAAVESFVTRFSFRRHLDYSLLEDLKSLRTKIHAEHWKRSEGGWTDLKLGVGGIRDVELFFHALQVIHGGKDPGLRVRSTGDAGRILAAKGLLPRAEAEFLIEHYWNLREIENYVQALNDEQTHRIDPAAAHPDFIVEKLVDLPIHLTRCNRLVSDLLGEPPPVPSRETLAAEAGEETDKALLDEILEIPILSRNKEKDEGIRRAFLGKFLEVLREQKANPAIAFEQLKEFIKSTRAKASFFNLLLREEKLLRELAWLFGHSRYLGRLLCYRPELLDAFVYRAQDLSSPDMERLLEDLVEKRLLAEIIEGSRFLRDFDMPKANAALTSTADGIVSALAQALANEHPTSIRLLALGKWGARETGFRSDLDFIFVIPGTDATDADHRFARRLISRLTEPHRGGSIYPVDMRLRPSGKAGPVVMPLPDLIKYLREDAAAWERQAYFRARWIDEPLADLRSEIFARPLSSDDLRELNRIRIELLPKKAGLDLKYSEGGLVDLELFAQTRALLEKRLRASANTLELMSEMQCDKVLPIYSRLRQIEQLGQLIAAQTFSKIEENDESLPLLAALLGFSSTEELKSHIEALLSESTEQLRLLDPRRGSG